MLRRSPPTRLAGRSRSSSVSPTITHKTDVGGVALDLRNEDELRAAFRAMVDRLSAAGRRQEVTGFLIEEMVNRTEGVETFVGITEAAAFGSLIGLAWAGRRSSASRRRLPGQPDHRRRRRRDDGRHPRRPPADRLSGQRRRRSCRRCAT